MKAQRLPSDRLSTLPQTIIETILCLLPIRDAVRTSILSRKWRYNWVNIPKLVFDEAQLLKVSTNTNQPLKICNLFYTIYQVLLVHRGPILEFTLSMSTLESCAEIDQIILHLLRKNTVKEFTLEFCYFVGYKLPSSFFSLKQLTHLYLQWCELSPPSRFDGISCLTNLDLDRVKTTTKGLLHLISSCPLLKSFSLIEYEGYFGGEGDSTIIELFECLPEIEHLCINIHAIEGFAQDGVPRELPTSLAHLKRFDLLDTDMSEYELSFAFLLIRSSPNLEKITIEIVRHARFSQACMGFLELQDNSDVWLDHLAELEVFDFHCLKRELEFLKVILVKSPVLKKVYIELSYTVSSDEELNMLKTLLRLPRASPLVQITVER